MSTYVVHAQCLWAITKSNSKTDKKYAKTIARSLKLWMKGYIDLQMPYIPTREQCELKDMCRYHKKIFQENGQ